MTPSPTLLDLVIVDDDEYLLQDLQSYFSQNDFRVRCVATGTEALEICRQQEVPVIIVDMQLPDMTGIDLIGHLQKAETDCEVIVLTGQGTIADAVESMKQGAIDFLTKPIRLKELEAVVRRAESTYQLKRKNQQLQSVLKRRQPAPPKMVGESAAMKSVFRLIERTAPTDKTILIQGESGTGKELVAHAIHEASQVADNPMIAFNCAALPDQLLESEMFGHEKGAFTGATSAKPGLFEIADGGTLFIDEIGELALPLQAKLLRVLEDGTYRRVGSIKQRRANVRLIAATNRDLLAEIQQGRFREDLFYRINILTISLPPLRHREGDLELLIRAFTGPDWQLEEGLITQLQRYNWPGNIRQLKNAIDRARILAEDQLLELKNFPEDILLELTGSTSTRYSTPVELGELTRQHVELIYRQQNGNKTSTARALGVSRRTLYRLLEKYQIHEP